jgi:hypothetical protein
MLENIKKCPPDFFERFVVDVLIKMGYGGSRKEAGQAMGKSDDGGIDGIINDEVGSDRTLLVLCTAFRARADRYPNLTVKKITKAVLARCEWGHDVYSLRVENLPQAPPPKGQMGLFNEEPD